MAESRHVLSADIAGNSAHASRVYVQNIPEMSGVSNED